MKIEIMVFCYGYEKRLNWMLSSIKDCRSVSEHDIQVRVSTFNRADSRLKFTAQSLQEFFGEFTRVECLDHNMYKTRGSHRSQQVQNLDEDTEAILFADADHLYDPLFFDSLIYKANEIEKISDGESNMYTVRRTSTDAINTMEELISKFHYPEYIPNTINLYNTMETRITSAPGAGNTQFVFVKDINKQEYVSENENADRNFFRSITYKSDIIFRKKFDKVVKLDLPYKQYHLQHRRYSFNQLVQQ